jgi:3-deoxy-D-manno-octulosonic-acid transferase
VNSLAAFLPSLRRRFPEQLFILSVTTRAGREQAAQLKGEIRRVFYLPIDLCFIVKRVLKIAEPQILLLAETELWPNLILQARRRGTKVALINGRMSERSLSRYLVFKGLMSKTLACMEMIFVQTEEDSLRFRALGAENSQVKVMGNFKGDLLVASQMRGERDLVRSSLGIPDGTKVLVAGSTRPGEEEKIAEAISGIMAGNDLFRAIVAPRHVKRSGKVTRIIRAKGLKVRRYSQLEGPSCISWNVLVVDNMGQLMRLYSTADVAFVGGSLLPYGGHNPLEPASYGIPVLFGPHMENCLKSARMLMETGGGMQVRDETQLQQVVSRIFSSDEERNRRGKAALQVVLKGQGSSEKTAAALEEIAV